MSTNKLTLETLKLIDKFYKKQLPEAFKIYIKDQHAGNFTNLLGAMSLVYSINQKLYDNLSEDDVKQLEFVIETMEHFIEINQEAK